jgi:hypothetical protein
MAFSLAIPAIMAGRSAGDKASLDAGATAG